MATLPRFQQMGIQYADLPRVSTAGIEAGARSYDVLGQSLDRMIDFAYKRQVTAAERKAKQYAIDFPPTKEQLQEAVKTGQFPKIKGAGDIFQQTYQSAASQLLAAELQFNVAERASFWQKKEENGEIVDPAVVRADLNDQLDGYASVLGAMNPDVALKFRASNTATTHSVYRQIVESSEKRQRQEIKTGVMRSIDNQRAVIRALFASAGEPAPDTGEPVPFQERLAVIENVYLDYSRLVGDNDIMKSFYAMVEQEKVQSLVTAALQPEFADNDVERVTRVEDGDFGALKEVWETMSPDAQKKVQDRLNGRLESIGKARTAYLNQQKDLGNSLENQIYLTTNRSQQLALFNQMRNIAGDPAQTKRVQDFLNDSGGAKADDLRSLNTLQRGVEAGTVNVDDVIRARDTGRITAATARSLVVSLSNPNADVLRAQRVIRSYSVIEEKGMPEMISSTEARSAAMVAENQSMLELMNFANTPRPDGTLPTSAEVRAKGNQLGQELRELTRPMLQSALSNTESAIIQITLPQLAGVDLMDENAVQAKFDEITSQPNGASYRNAILSARNQIAKYRELKQRIDQQ